MTPRRHTGATSSIPSARVFHERRRQHRGHRQGEAARHWYEESLAIWITLRDTKKLAPDQIDRPAQIEERIAHSAAAAAQR